MPPLTRIIPALVHIQADLDQDLSLDALADHVGLSRFIVAPYAIVREGGVNSTPSPS